MWPGNPGVRTLTIFADIVWGNRVFLTTAIEGRIEGHQPLKHYIKARNGGIRRRVAGNRRHTFQVVALDASDGKILWTGRRTEEPVTTTSSQELDAARAATDGTLCTGTFGAEGLYAYRFDGTLAWSARLGKLGR